MTNYTIGAQMYSVRTLTQDEAGLLSTMKALKEMGYTQLQYSGAGKDIPAEAFAEYLQETNTLCGSTHISFQEMEEDLDKVIKNHKLWNCAYPGIGGLPGEYRESKEGYLEFARKADAIAEKLEGEGMHFVYHNHAFEFMKFDGVPALQILMENTKFMQFELDLFWVQAGGGSPLDWIKKVEGRMDVVHFKEMTGALKPVMMAPIGEGNMNWPVLMKACEDIGVKLAFVEQDNAVDTDPLGCMKTSHDNLVKMGGSF